MKKWMYIVPLVLLAACGEEEKPKQIDWDQKKSTEFNKELAIEQEMQIKFFLEQHRDWKLEKTGSGLQYYVYEKGEGDQAQPGMKAQVEMEVSLLDGTSCYKTAKDEIEEFVVDKSDIETGVQEGIKKLHVGDRAKLIIPSHLAHGLVGDMDKIPPLTVILVDIHLIGLLK